MLSDKAKSRVKITLVEDKTITTQDEKNAELFFFLFFFFSRAVKNRKVPEFNATNHLAEWFFNTTFKKLLKYKNHTGTDAIRNTNNFYNFRFNEVSVEEVYEEITKLNSRKDLGRVRILEWLSKMLIFCWLYL